MPATATLDRPTTSRPQRLDALEQANRVRLARAAIKRQIADGTLPVTRVLREAPGEAQGQPISPDATEGRGHALLLTRERALYPRPRHRNR